MKSKQSIERARQWRAVGAHKTKQMNQDRRWARARAEIAAGVEWLAVWGQDTKAQAHRDARARARVARRVRRVVTWGDEPSRLARLGFVAPFEREGATRAAYVAWWYNIDAHKLTVAAKRAARSVRAGRVSDTSREEAQGAARAALVDAVASLAPLHLTSAINVATGHGSTAMVAAIAAARHSLRGDTTGGGRGRDSKIKHRAALNEDGTAAIAWDMATGEWRTFKRADGCAFVDMAGRIVTEARDTIDGHHHHATADCDGAQRARGAGKLAVWLAGRRVAALASDGAKARPAAVAHVRRTAARWARVLRAVARGESMHDACASVGWTGADSFRKASDRLAPDGLGAAWREYGATLAA